MMAHGCRFSLRATPFDAAYLMRYADTIFCLLFDAMPLPLCYDIA